MTSLTAAVNDSHCELTSSPYFSGYERFIKTTVIAVVSGGIIVSNVVNLTVLASASAAMPWATRLFLINLSSSDLLVGVVSCAPAVLPAATDRWTYGDHHRTSCLLSSTGAVKERVYAVSQTGGHTVMFGAKYPELLTVRHVLSQSGVYQWSDCRGSDLPVFNFSCNCIQLPVVLYHFCDQCRSTGYDARRSWLFVELFVLSGGARPRLRTFQSTDRNANRSGLRCIMFQGCETPKGTSEANSKELLRYS